MYKQYSAYSACNIGLYHSGLILVLIQLAFGVGLFITKLNAQRDFENAPRLKFHVLVNGACLESYLIENSINSAYATHYMICANYNEFCL